LDNRHKNGCTIIIDFGINSFAMNYNQKVTRKNVIFECASNVYPRVFIASAMVFPIFSCISIQRFGFFESAGPPLLYSSWILQGDPKACLLLI